MFYSLSEARVMLAPSLKNTEERELVVDSGASMHMLELKDLSSGELESLRKSRNPTVVFTAMVKCMPTRKHKLSFTISFCS